ncbi:MAG: lactonase family protein [Gammaproteobacteria bacterium]|nr:lactonase family protein [Gammaproteobacteria bacterium]
MYRLFILFTLSLGMLFYSMTSNANTRHQSNNPFVGAVYAMSNDADRNMVVAYGRNADGTLDLIGKFRTSGAGGAFDGGEGLDPLISAYSILLTDNKRHLLVVNAGSRSITVFRINDDFSLRRTDRRRVVGVGPNSIAYHDGRVYVASIDADGQFTGEPDQEGALTGFTLSPRGELRPIRDSVRILENRPSAIQFSPDGKFLVVTSINAGSAALNSASNDEVVVYQVKRNGLLSEQPVGRSASTLPNNAQGRNLASAIGFEIVEDAGKRFVVVTEAREFQPDGTPPAFPNLQTGSVSTWQLLDDGQLELINLDVLAGDTFSDGERTACWIEFSRDEKTFWVSNALDSTLSSYSFNEGQISLIEQVEAAGAQPDNSSPENAFATTDGWIDLWLSADGRYLYQLFGLSGTIGVFRVNEDGHGLTEIQKVSDLPQVNTQGIVAF